MMDSCASITAWVRRGEGYVAAIHCKAGKGRTGTIIAAWLMHAGFYKKASAAMRFYGRARTANRKGVTIPSQQRYVFYYELQLRAIRAFAAAQGIDAEHAVALQLPGTQSMTAAPSAATMALIPFAWRAAWTNDGADSDDNDIGAGLEGREAELAGTETDAAPATSAATTAAEASDPEAGGVARRLQQFADQPLHYDWTKNNPAVRAPVVPLQVQELVFSHSPVGAGSRWLELTILHNGHTRVYSSKAEGALAEARGTGEEQALTCGNTVIAGDMKVIVKYTAGSTAKSLHFWLNTAFITSERWVLRKHDLDKAVKDSKHHKLLPADFHITVVTSGPDLQSEPICPGDLFVPFITASASDPLVANDDVLEPSQLGALRALARSSSQPRSMHRASFTRPTPEGSGDEGTVTVPTDDTDDVEGREDGRPLVSNVSKGDDRKPSYNEQRLDSIAHALEYAKSPAAPAGGGSKARAAHRHHGERKQGRSSHPTGTAATAAADLQDAHHDRRSVPEHSDDEIPEDNAPLSPSAPLAAPEPVRHDPSEHVTLDGSAMRDLAVTENASKAPVQRAAAEDDDSESKTVATTAPAAGDEKDGIDADNADDADEGQAEEDEAVNAEAGVKADGEPTAPAEAPSTTDSDPSVVTAAKKPAAAPADQGGKGGRKRKGKRNKGRR